MKGIRVVYKNGRTDHFDPCDEIKIDNGYAEYIIKVDEIKELDTYETEAEEEE